MQEAQRRAWAELFGVEPAELEIIETHISWVFLCPEVVYKLKKRVKFDFLDFSTVELREQACRDELRLNRRLSRDVYLDVVPLTEFPSGERQLGSAESHGGDHAETKGVVIDWLVKMRRLPHERTLDVLLAQQAVTARQCQEIAGMLTDFYRSAPPAALDAADYREHLAQHIRGNWTELARAEHQLPREWVESVHRGQLAYLMLQEPLINGRVEAGRVIEGHGDLRPEHICLTEPPAIFDCIEFSQEFRTLDVADELAFLGMECDFLGEATVGNQIWQHYQQASGDAPPESLSLFYKSYRACVRGKVAALRAAQHSGSEARDALDEAYEYVRLAHRYVEQFAPPVLIIMGGISGSGKSTLAREVADKLGCELLRSDVIRQEVESSLAVEQRYSPAARQQVYQQLQRRAAGLLDQGRSVILDATYLTRADRTAARALAARRGLASLSVHCVCPPEVAKQRIAQRAAAGNDASEASPALVDEQLDRWEADSKSVPSVQVDTQQELPSQVLAVCAALRHLFFEQPGR